jgi:hypothetical protein
MFLATLWQNLKIYMSPFKKVPYVTRQLLLECPYGISKKFSIYVIYVVRKCPSIGIHWCGSGFRPFAES